MKISVCTGCRLGRDGFLETVQAACGTAQIMAQVTGVECMSGCAREQTIAFRSFGKVAYLFGDITAADLPDLLAFARLYQESPDGQFADARPLGALRHKAIARIPG